MASFFTIDVVVVHGRSWLVGCFVALIQITNEIIVIKRMNPVLSCSND